MSRIVRAATIVRQPPPMRTFTVGTGRLQAGEQPETIKKEGDGYLDRVAKYIPAEIVGFFLFVNNILQEADKPDHSGIMVGISVHTISLWLFFVALILTPIYIWSMSEGGNGKTGEAWKLNAFVATLAFPVWAYAMGAVLFDHIHDGNLASIFLATFTVCSGLIKPKPQSADDGNAHGGGHGNNAGGGGGGDPARPGAPTPEPPAATEPPSAPEKPAAPETPQPPQA